MSIMPFDLPITFPSEVSRLKRQAEAERDWTATQRIAAVAQTLEVVRALASLMGCSARSHGHGVHLNYSSHLQRREKIPHSRTHFSDSGKEDGGKENDFPFPHLPKMEGGAVRGKGRSRPPIASQAFKAAPPRR